MQEALSVKERSYCCVLSVLYVLVTALFPWCIAFTARYPEGECSKYAICH